MHFKKAYDSEHLSSVDLDGRTVTIEITGVEATKIKGESGEESKLLVRFNGKTKTTWIVPITVAHCLAAMFGEDTDGWIGKRVTIHAEKVESFGETVDAIRPVGSPDIAKPVSFKVRQGRRRVAMTMRPTGKPADPQPEAQS